MKSTLALAGLLAGSNAAVIDKRQLLGGLSRAGGLAFLGPNLPLMSPYIPLLPSGISIAKRTAAQPVRSEVLPAQRFPQAKRKSVTWGPFQLEAVNGTHNFGRGGIKLDKWSDLIEEHLEGFCEDCMLLDVHIDVSDKTGRILVPKDEVYTHHIILGQYGKITPANSMRVTSLCANADGSKKTTTTPNMAELAAGLPFQGAGPFGLPFTPANLGDMLASFTNSKMILVKGPEQNGINFMGQDLKSGVWLGKNETIMTSIEVVNYRNVPQNVYVTADIEYQEYEAKPASYMRTDMATFLGVDCEHMLMHPPSDKPVTYESPEYVVDKPMYLVNLNPHLHDGATNMRININGKLACDAEVLYGKSGGLAIDGREWETIKSTTPCDTIKLNAGDKVKMTSEFDLTKHKLRPSSANHAMGAEAMAIGFVQFAYPE